MSQSLTIELNDQAFESIRRQAEAVGKSPAELAGDVLDQRFNGKHKPADKRTEAEKEAARQRFRTCIGAADLGYPTGADNESIDADLAREYGSTHEED